MAAVVTILVAGVIALATAAGIGWVIAKTRQSASANWYEIGQMGLLTGGVAGFVLGEVLTDPDTLTWHLPLWPGLFVGAFIAMIPGASSSSRVLGWVIFGLGALFGLFLGAILGGF